MKITPGDVIGFLIAALIYLTAGFAYASLIMYAMSFFTGNVYPPEAVAVFVIASTLFVLTFSYIFKNIAEFITRKEVE